MKNVIKRSLWIVAFLCFSLFAATVLGGLSVKANAEADAYFKMMDGAYIRPVTETLEDVEDQNGIRFSTYLSKAYVDALDSEYTFTDIEYYTLIATDGRAVEDLTYGADGVTAISWKPNFNEDGSYTRNTDLLNCPAEYYRTEFTVLSCIRLVNSEEEVAVVYADANDVKRSMEGCAIAHLTANPDEAGDFGKYLGGGEIYVDEAAANAEVSGAAEIEIDNIATDLSAKTLAVYNGARKVENATISADGVLTLPAAEIEKLSAGKEYVYTVSDGTDVYKKTVNTWDFIISDADEFDAFVSAVRATTFINGMASSANADIASLKQNEKYSSHPYYAILDSDITLTKTYTTNKVNGANWNGVFEGTLDGDGHVLSGLKIGSSELFSALGGTATIKNIAIANATQSNTGVSYLVAGSSTGNLHVENSYIDATFATAGRIGLLNIGSTISLTNSVLEFTKTKESTFGVFYASQPEKIENSVIIANCGLGVEPSEKWSNWGLYSDYVAVKDAELDYLSAFDTNYWTVSNGYPVYNGVTATATVFVDSVSYQKNRNSGFTFDVSDYSSDITAVTVDGTTITDYSAANGVVTVENSVLKNDMVSGALVKDHTVAAVAEIDGITVSLTNNVELVDFALGTKAELSAFISYLRANSEIDTKAALASERLYVILDNDIDWEGANEFYTRSATTIGYFTGVLDGLGHTIANAVVNSNSPFWGLAAATVKNVAFVNFVKNTASVGSLLAWNGYGTNTIENVYIQGTSATNGSSEPCGLGNNYGNSSVKNVVINIEFTAGVGGNITANAGAVTGFKNVYGISTTANAFHKTESIPADCAFYTSAADFRADSAVIFENFDEKYWDVETGTLTFTSAKKFLTYSNALAINIATAAEDSGTYYLMAGEHTVASDPNGATFSLANAVDGVTLTGNTLTIADTVSAGTTITINAEYYDFVYGNTLSASKTFKVAGTETIDISETQLVGKNRADKVVLDISSYGKFTTENIKGATFNGTSVISDAIINGNNLEVTCTNFATAIDTLSVVVMNTSGTYTFNIPVRTVDFAIGTVEQFKGWVTYVQGVKNNAGTLTRDAGTANYKVTNTVTMAALTANILLSDSDAFTAGATGYLRGELDGQGYYIDNLQHNVNGLFCDISQGNFTLKNIGLSNVKLNRNGVAYLFNTVADGFIIMENVYLHIASVGNTTSNYGITNNGSQLIIKNSVFDFAFTEKNTTTPVFRAAQPANVALKGYTVQNFIAISKATLCPSSSDALTGTGSYSNYIRCESYDALATAIENGDVTLDEFTNNNYWTISDDGYPVWKTLDAALNP